jgi:glycosyltransferase involved in cell wall biosynthesis
MTAPVAINARAAARRETGGVERVAAALAAELPALRPGRYRVLRPPGTLAHRAGHAWEQAVLPAAARGSRLILSPANLAPLLSRRNVVMVHDLAPIVRPDWYRGAYGAWHRALVPRIARGARRVLTVSEFSKGELVERLGIAPEAIRVAPPGVDPAFSPHADPAPARGRHGIEGPYVLTVATRGPRKNLGALDVAAERLADEGVDLVAAGSTRAYMGREERPARARALGYVAEEHLPGLYAGALAFVLPSLYEGFGLPCVEAMACGTPVVAADAAALPEACAGAALLADPADAEALAAASLAAALDEGERTRLVAAGRERAAELTWRRTAELVDGAVEELL